jgi:hypothetical protein
MPSVIYAGYNVFIVVLNVIMLSVTMLNAIILIVIMLVVIILIVVAPPEQIKTRFQT